ncbi:hypothetical protein CR513_36681, partial [Mucuna pruriens]
MIHGLDALSTMGKLFAGVAGSFSVGMDFHAWSNTGHARLLVPIQSRGLRVLLLLCLGWAQPYFPCLDFMLPRLSVPLFDHIVAKIEESKNLQRMRRNDGGGNKNKKGKWKNKLKDSNEGPKVTNQNSSGNNYKNNEGYRKFNKNGSDQNRRRQRKFAKKNIGHFADKCYKNKGKQKKEVEAQMTQGDSDDSDSNHTGCSNHITGNKRWFVNLDEKVKRVVKFADNSTITAKGMDIVLIHRRDR